MTIESEIRRAVNGGYAIEIKYEKYSGEVSQRKVSALSYNNEFGEYGYSNAHIKGYCHLRNEERTFKISRIMAVRVLPSGSWVNRSVNSAYLGSTCSNANYGGRFNTIPSSGAQSSRPTSHTSSSGGCYVATMAYGSYDAPQVLVLRWYRDNILQKSGLGRLFIRIYYYLSPKAVRHLEHYKTINSIIRKLLDTQVSWVKKQMV